jgi:hypothetical protein
MPGRDDRIQLVGLDVGSTTSRVALASARVIRSAVTGRPEHVCRRDRAALVAVGPAAPPPRFRSIATACANGRTNKRAT